MPQLSSKNIPTSFIALGLAILVLFCHGLTVTGDFMVDDFYYLRPDQTELYYLSFKDFFVRFYGHHFNPLDIIVNYYAFKILNAPLYLYAFNLVLFYINSFLLFVNIRHWTKHQAVATLSAALFILHPINAENLSHITFNTVFLSSIFMQLSLLAFWNYLSSPKSSKILIYLGLLTSLGALMLLETAWLLPVYMCLLCLLKPARERLRILFLSIPFWGLSLAYFIVWCFMTSEGSQWTEKIQYLNISVGGYVATLGLLMKWYLGNLLLPNDPVFIKSSALLTEHLLPWIAGVSGSLIIMGVLISFWRKSQKGFALLWFLSGFLFMLPASLIHAYKMGVAIEPHWFFFSSGGFFMLLALLFQDLKPRIQPYLSSALLGTFVLFWTITSYQHHLIARTERSYLEYWIKISPRNFMPSRRLAQLYSEKEGLRIPESLLSDMEVQVEEFFQTKKYGAAAILLNKMLICYPQHPRKNVWRSILKAVDLKIGKTPNIDVLLTDLSIHPPAARDYLILVITLEKLELRNEALAVINQGLRNPQSNHSGLILLKATLLANQNRFDEAESLLNSRISDSATNKEFSLLLKQIQDTKKKTLK